MIVKWGGKFNWRETIHLNEHRRVRNIFRKAGVCTSWRMMTAYQLRNVLLRIKPSQKPRTKNSAIPPRSSYGEYLILFFTKKINHWWTFQRGSKKHALKGTSRLRGEEEVIPGSLVVKNPPDNAGATGGAGTVSGREDALEEGMATHSSIPAWRTPRTGEPGRLQSTGLQRVGHDRSDLAHVHTWLIISFNITQHSNLIFLYIRLHSKLL